MKALVAVILLSVLGAIGTLQVAAASSIVISQLQTGDVMSASNEAVELYNNSATDVDISNWCIRYSSSSSETNAASPKFCFTSTDPFIKMFLRSYSYATVATSNFGTTTTVVDGRMTGSGLAAAGGHIRLIDTNGTVVDTVGWGTALYPETLAAPAPSTVQSIWRKAASQHMLQDTGNNQLDFQTVQPTFRSGGLYEVRSVIDMCGNIDGVQEVVPSDYGYDEAGDCALLASDVCLNIELIQQVPPAGMLADANTNCVPDVCTNLDGLQATLPVGYALGTTGCTKLEDRVLLVTEVFANASGTDTGYEFIEIYNPGIDPVPLIGYKLAIGKNFEKLYELAAGDPLRTIAAGEYLTFYDSELKFSLLNTTSGVRLLTPAGSVASETVYSEPKDDASWSLFDDGWSYTDLSTPRAQNQRSHVLADEDIASSSALAPCAAGKYRHPITNRCRNIESDTNMLVACDNDEYRNPETNRCRKIATLASSLTPCNIGYERNPETNRCRKSGSTEASLVPCQSGYERNPSTNRCRKVASASASTVATAVTDQAGSTATSVLLLTAGLGAVSYGLYEWRSEVGRGFRRVLQFLAGR